MNINEEDYTVASLARLVGSELNIIDKYTEGRSSGPVNKLDPRTFLNKNHNVRVQNKNIAKHDGMSFYAGIDESVVQSLHPDSPQSVLQAPPAEVFSQEPMRMSSVATASPPPLAAQDNTLTLSIDKTLKSIDKTLKSIDKSQKLVLESIKNINLNNLA